MKKIDSRHPIFFHPQSSARSRRRPQKRPYHYLGAAWLKRLRNWFLRGAFVGGYGCARLLPPCASRTGRQGRGRVDLARRERGLVETGDAVVPSRRFCGRLRLRTASGSMREPRRTPRVGPRGPQARRGAFCDGTAGPRTGAEASDFCGGTDPTAGRRTGCLKRPGRSTSRSAVLGVAPPRRIRL